MTTMTTHTFPSNVTEVSTESLALVGFAARLGTCVNNDDTTDTDGQEAKSVRDEAMLLMSLLMGEKAEEILSDVKESRCAKRKRRSEESVRPKNSDIGVFSFTFPSLSLQRDGFDGLKPPSEIPEASRTKGNEMEQPTPSQLLGRTQRVFDKDLIRDSSEIMAYNVLESFGVALVWRAKTWIKSLADVLALKEQKRIDALKAAACSGGDDNDEGDLDVCNESRDDLMNSKEMQIIDAIVRSSEEVSVVNVKTSFRVLPNSTSCLSHSCDELVRIEDQQGSASNEFAEVCSNNEVHKYKVTHKLVFEATISMTSNDGVRYNGVTLQAPGLIQGTFVQNTSSSMDDDDETLTAVSVTLDTDALAQSLERQSRLVVRQAAEAAFMTARGIDSSSSHNHESTHVHHAVISPRYVLMSPLPADRFLHNSTSKLPSIPSKEALSGEPLSEKTASVVSSSEGCSSDSSADTRLSLTPSSNKKAKLPAPLSPSLPALLSVANEERTRGE